MRIVILFLAFSFFLNISPTHAASNRCPRQQIKTNLKAKLAGTKTYKGSVESFSDYVLGHDRGNSRVLGFVNQSEIFTEFNYGFDVQKHGENQYCVSLTDVDGYFYARPKIYLPTNYKKNSCEYQQIKKHEKRHLQAVYDFHKKNTGKYASYMGRIACKVPTYPPVSSQEEVEQVKQGLINFFESEFRPFENESIEQLRAAQKKIDSPSEYIGVKKRCDNW